MMNNAKQIKTKIIHGGRRLHTWALWLADTGGGVFFRASAVLHQVWRFLRHRPPSRRSLRLRLVLFFTLFLVVAWFMAALFAWKECREYIDEFFDTQQMLFAKRLTATDFSNAAGALPQTKRLLPKKNKQAFGELEDDSIGFAVFTANGKIAMTDGEKGQRFTYVAGQQGFANVPLAGKKDVWRIIYLKAMDGEHVIAVGQEMEYRQEIALDMLIEQIVPWLLLVPILILGLLFLLTRELAPLRAMANQLGKRTPDDSTPLDISKIPYEALPLAKSLNSFFSRISSMLARERAFISDAAHELRTPLAGLRVQAQVASQEGISHGDRDEALSFLRQGTDRCARLVDQLLALSRLEAMSPPNLGDYKDVALQYEIVELRPLLAEILQVYSAKLETKGIRLEYFPTDSSIKVPGYPALLKMLLRNIFDNAVNYTPDGGSISVLLEEKLLVVENTANPLPKQYAERLGVRFFRPPGLTETGSGLGLSIVKRIVEIHGFTMSMQLSSGRAGASHGIYHIDISW